MVMGIGHRSCSCQEFVLSERVASSRDDGNCCEKHIWNYSRDFSLCREQQRALKFEGNCRGFGSDMAPFMCMAFRQPLAEPYILLEALSKFYIPDA